MARFSFRTKPDKDSDPDDAGGGAPGAAMAALRNSAGVLAARFGVGGRTAPTTFIEIPDEDGGERRLTDFAFPAAVCATILLLAGNVAWLSLSAEDTMRRLAEMAPRIMVPVVLPDGSPRLPAANAAAASGDGQTAAAPPVEERAVDPVDIPVTLAPSRNETLLERGRAGVLPRVGADGTQPWQHYARPFPQDDPRPRIALVVTDVGISQSAAENAIARLPGAVTFAIPAGLKDAQPLVDRMRGDGHEVLLSVPMEPVGFPRNDPGPGTLLTSLTDERNVERLETAMATATGYVGLTSTTGTAFTRKAENLRPILQQTQRRGLLYVDSWLVPDSRVTRLATELGLPRAVSDGLVDRVASAGGIDAQLKELERLAMANGVAVGFAQPLPVTVERIATWAATLRDRGIVLAPVTAVVNRQADR